MKKIYLKPETEIVKVVVQNLLNTISGTETETAAANDPNKDNEGTGTDPDGGNGEMAVGGEHDVLGRVVARRIVIFHRDTGIGGPLLRACHTDDVHRGDGSVGLGVGTIDDAAAIVGEVVVTGSGSQVGGLRVIRAVLIEQQANLRDIAGVSDCVVGVAVDDGMRHVGERQAGPGGLVAIGVPCVHIDVVHVLGAHVANIDVELVHRVE